MKSCCGPQRNQKKFKKDIYHDEKISFNKFTDKMIYLSGGDFLMGTNIKEGFPEDNEGPIRDETVKPFYIDSYAVTNEEFHQFVLETNYKTDAEQYGWSFVFYQFLPKDIKGITQQLPSTPWWFAVENANWRQPEGADTNIQRRWNHPVVHISWNDARAFSAWAGKRLPTEKEWEYAARGGLEQQTYPWGNELTPNGNHMCNIWQGKFPTENTEEDGYRGTAPAQAFLQNDYGLFSMSGNVWEWCENSFFVELPDHENRAIRGGSYLCHDSYCNRYRLAARSSNTKDSSTGNMGFRCVRDE